MGALIDPQTRRHALQHFAAGFGSALLPHLLSAAPKKDKDLTSRSPEVKEAVTLGLDHLADTQKRTGLWEATDKQYSAAQSCMVGLAMLMNGSTLLAGPYRDNLFKLTNYLCFVQRENGLLCDPKKEQRYSFVQGLALLFLSQIAGDVPDKDMQDTLQDVIKLGVSFACNSQADCGGWYYSSAKDSGGSDEASTIGVVLQGLRAAKNLHIPVPVETMGKAVKYIHDLTNKDGGMSYSVGRKGNSLPGISCCTIAGLIAAGEYKSSLTREMIAYCKRLYSSKRSHQQHWDYGHYYLAQTLYMTSDPTWPEYRNDIYHSLLRTQKQNGSWGFHGPAIANSSEWVYPTATSLCMLQLELNFLPFYQRMDFIGEPEKVEEKATPADPEGEAQPGEDTQPPPPSLPSLPFPPFRIR